MSGNVRDDIHRRTRRRRLKRWIRRTLISMSVFLAVLGVSSGVLGLESVNIDKIRVRGNSAVNAKEIKGFVENQMAGSYFRLFSKKSTFIYPDESIQKKALENFKRLKELDLDRDGFSALSVKVGERKPYALWCSKYTPAAGGGRFGEKKSKSEEEGELTNEEKNERGNEDKKDVGENYREEEKGNEHQMLPREDCYFVDKTGFIFANAPYFTNEIYFKYYIPLAEGAASTSPKGARLFAESEFKRVDKFLKILHKFDLKPTQLVHREARDYEVMLSSGGKLIFSLDQDLSEVVSDLQSALGSKVFDSKDRSVRDLKYLDLRFGNKIFYKFK